jgi:hypothetical protein
VIAAELSEDKAEFNKDSAIVKEDKALVPILIEGLTKDEIVQSYKQEMAAIKVALKSNLL